jgi:hypothetical protein
MMLESARVSEPNAAPRVTISIPEANNGSRHRVTFNSTGPSSFAEISLVSRVHIDSFPSHDDRESTLTFVSTNAHITLPWFRTV